ncbi:putative phosphoglycerate mutase (2,3-diphosphoglycerate-dependent) [Helianthus annuus]|nr:putative phosphoglycerate mutase (2,3-diphosphoglycerate-dependent) [Helianthus annuus]
MCLQRAVTYFKENVILLFCIFNQMLLKESGAHNVYIAQIEPQLMAGKHVMVVAHANSLRSIIMYLDNLSPQEVINLELSTGVPMLYIYKDGTFIRRGSPPGTKGAGVYAYTSVTNLTFICS